MPDYVVSEWRKTEDEGGILQDHRNTKHGQLLHFVSSRRAGKCFRAVDLEGERKKLWRGKIEKLSERKNRQNF